MKRILIVTGIFTPDIGGPASYARTLGAQLASHGVNVSVLTYSSVRTHKADTEFPFRIHRVWTKLPWGIRHMIFFVKCLLLARCVDGILSLNAVSAGLPAMCVARIVGCPFVLRIVGDYAWEIAIQTGRTSLLIDDFQKSKKSGRIHVLDDIQKYVARRASRIIVPSNYLAQIVRQWGINKERIEVIYNGVSARTITVSKEDARRHIGISGAIILSAGRLVSWKGFRMLIKIMPQLLSVNQFFRLVIVGDGPDMRMLSSVVRNLGLERKVYLVGRVSSEEMSWYLASADMFVLNTGYEGFSHQILEAMTAGVPVITTMVGGNKEVVEQGKNGFLVRYNDEFNIVEAIKTLWRQQELREQFSVNGRESASAYTSERMSQQTSNLLHTIFK